MPALRVQIPQVLMTQRCAYEMYVKQFLPSANKIAAELGIGTIEEIGASLTGTYLASSDVDLNLRMTAGMEQKKALFKLWKLLRPRFNVTARLTKQPPVLKLLDKKMKFEIDICVDNRLARRATQLVQAYCAYEERCKKLIILVKDWARRNGFVGSQDGMLSGYGWALLVIYFLQTGVEPPVILDRFNILIRYVKDRSPKRRRSYIFSSGGQILGNWQNFSKLR